MENLYVNETLYLTEEFLGLKKGTAFTVSTIYNGKIVLANEESGYKLTLPRNCVSKYFRRKIDKETVKNVANETDFLLSMTSADTALVDKIMFEEDKHICKIPVLKEDIISHALHPSKNTGVVVLKLPCDFVDLMTEGEIITSITIADVKEWYNTAKKVNDSKSNF